MVETGYLTNQYFIATPNLLDPGFFFTTLPFISKRSVFKNNDTTAVFVSQSVKPALSIDIHPVYGHARQI